MVSQLAAWMAWRTGDLATAEAESDAVLAAVAAEDLSHRGDGGARDGDARRDLRGPRASRPLRAAADALLAVRHALWRRSARDPQTLAARGPRAAYPGVGRTAAGARARRWPFATKWQAADLDTPTLSWRLPAALAAVRLGDDDEARSLAAALKLARRWGTASDLGAALRSRRACRWRAAAGRSGRRDQGTRGCSRAAEEHARAVVDLGEALRVARRRKEAHDALRRGAELRQGLRLAVCCPSARWTASPGSATGHANRCSPVRSR